MKEFTLLILAHILGDYYLQPNWLAKLKERSFLGLLLHSLIYAGMMFAALFLYYSRYFLYGIIVAAVTHAAIDTAKHIYLNGRHSGERKAKAERNAFFVDQALHFAIILLVSFLSAAYASDAHCPRFIQEIFPRLRDFDFFFMLASSALLLGAMKPANLAVSKLLGGVLPGDPSASAPIGALVGSAERLICAVLIINGELFGAVFIPAVQAMLSLRAVKDPREAKRCLTGSLLSFAYLLLLYGALRAFGTL